MNGTHPFNSQNKDDLNLLEELKSQGKEYKIWSESDVAKINSALENGIHMYLIYRTSGKGWENVDIYEIKDHFISALDSSDIQQIYLAAFQAKTDYGYDLAEGLAEQAVGQMSYLK